MSLTAIALNTNLDAIERLRAATSLKELVAAGTQWADSNGFDHWIYGIGAPAAPHYLGAFPRAWIDGASHGKLPCDPMLLTRERVSRPIAWDFSSRQGFTSPLTITRQRLMMESVEHGLRSGITVPALSPDGRANCYLAVCNATSVDPKLRLRQKPFAHLFLDYFQRELARVAGTELFNPLGEALSPRELECLKFASHGKTSSQIAEVVGIAPATVNFHITNASKKLGANTRSQAIRIAFRQRLPGFAD